MTWSSVPPRRLGVEHPDWHVWWGIGTRRFWAVPCWRGARIPLVSAARSGELIETMDEEQFGSLKGDPVFQVVPPGQSLFGPNAPA